MKFENNSQPREQKQFDLILYKNARDLCTTVGIEQNIFKIVLFEPKHFLLSSRNMYCSAAASGSNRHTKTLRHTFLKIIWNARVNFSSNFRTCVRKIKKFETIHLNGDYFSQNSDAMLMMTKWFFEFVRIRRRLYTKIWYDAFLIR